MSRKVVLGVCKVCGGQARVVNFSTQSKGKKYHYFKFVHLNGTNHLYRRSGSSDRELNETVISGRSISDILVEIVEVKMRENELKFGDIKSLLEEAYGKPVGVATLYRHINKLLRLDLISKRLSDDQVLYGRNSIRKTGRELKTTRMSISLDFRSEETSVTMFIHLKNLGIGTVSKYTIYLPFGGLETFDQIGLTAFDELEKIRLTRDNISYSASDQTGITIELNRTLHKLEEENIFLNYKHKFQEGPIKMIAPSDIDLIKLDCMVEKGDVVQIKKRLLDGLKEIEPMIVRKSGIELGRSIIEVEFENVSRGDTLVISKGN